MSYLLHFELCSTRPYLADLTLASPPTDDKCFGIANNPEAITIRLYTDCTPDCCHNITSVFSNGQEGKRNYTCDPSSCPDSFMPLELEKYSPETSYSYTSLAYPSRGISQIGVDSPGFTLKCSLARIARRRKRSRGSRGAAVRTRWLVRNCRTAWRVSDLRRPRRRISMNVYLPPSRVLESKGRKPVLGRRC
jgi:hypothetical protein